MNFWQGERRVRGGIVMLIFTVLGTALWLQPDRWARTPSYGILLNIFDQQWWGTCYLGIAVLMIGYVAWPTRRALAVVAHTAAVALIGVWLVGFGVRYFTDDATTVVNVVSWSTFMYLVVRSALLIDVDPVKEVDQTTGEK